MASPSSSQSSQRVKREFVEIAGVDTGEGAQQLNVTGEIILVNTDIVTHYIWGDANRS